MVNEHQAPQRRLVGRGQFAFIGMLIVVAGIGGAIAGRSFGQASNRSSQLPSGNELTIPSGGLVFKSKEGKLAAKLDADEGGGLLIIYNTAEKPVITVGGSPYGGGALIGLSNGKGAGAALQLSADEQGGSVSLLSQKRGKRVLVLSADDDGGNISVNGPTGDEAVTISTNNQPSAINGTIEVRESQSGKLLWTSPTGTSKRP